MKELKKIFNKIKKLVAVQELFKFDKSRAFYLIGGVLLLIALALNTLLLDRSTSTGIVFLLAAFILMLGFLNWHIPLIYKSWNNDYGKLLIGIVHVFILVIATVFARNLLTQSLGLPGKDFQISLSILTLLVYLPVWLGVISLFFGIGFYILSLFSHSNDPKKNLYQGHVLGSFGTLIFLYFIFLLINKNESVHSTIRLLAFYSDYDAAFNYPEIKENQRISFHENGVVSYAWYQDGEVTIEIRKTKE